MNTPESLESHYETLMPAIEDNYNRVKQFPVFEDWFYREYGELLNEC
jgi:hypothetical protein